MIKRSAHFSLALAAGAGALFLTFGNLAHGAERMCAGRTAERDAEHLARTQSGKVLRLLVTVTTAGNAERGAVDQATRAVAEALRAGGAHMAAPIPGQPLLVAEIDREQLAALGRNPAIACIASDKPDPSN